MPILPWLCGAKTSSLFTFLLHLLVARSALTAWPWTFVRSSEVKQVVLSEHPALVRWQTRHAMVEPPEELTELLSVDFARSLHFWRRRAAFPAHDRLDAFTAPRVWCGAEQSLCSVPVGSVLFPCVIISLQGSWALGVRLGVPSSLNCHITRQKKHLLSSSFPGEMSRSHSQCCAPVWSVCMT